MSTTTGPLTPFAAEPGRFRDLREEGPYTISFAHGELARRLKLHTCPACGERFGPFTQVPYHIETHDPEDFGLSPLWGDAP